ncbi:SDR family NAD(P)-dependent oxidoreductase [Companilactobacillus halodurans]|uniref:SDR family NAD(P)-dependent oxidoreductase n=1 Tax=Companilactobacillus halodurans TaxID=2584183 RepID=A0A5P0ZMT9_9LACO|nr:SDR family NAD(P)-dependent oxidoreductase [Companilactobacillus halodurans]MQS75535.1 SDR family NAD(P)-dependent oxidoreductase [Companilactobacillus halodurans]MQS97779.1 SDR family NAD(P)-dependent oxidoreductase [Companilactobacillus halodurans]
MAKIFVTGSTTGLGFLIAKDLIAKGNEVILHARNDAKKTKVEKELPKAKAVVVGDLSSISEVKSIADQVNKLGTMDAIIQNAGVYNNDSKMTFDVNVLAPYLLTALINKPKRMVYTSSGMHQGSSLNLDDLENETSYSSSKLQVILLMKQVAKKWPDVAVNSVDPGWVPTRMGGKFANDDLTMGYTTQIELATAEKYQKTTGHDFHHLRIASYDKRIDDEKIQTEFIEKLVEMTGIKIPD